MKNLTIVGLSGRMGTAIGTLAPEYGLTLIGGVGFGTTSLNVPLLSPAQAQTSPGDLTRTDVIIDFTGPEGFETALQIARALNIPLVSGSTGLSRDHFAALADLAKTVPALHGSNMSLGVNLLLNVLPTITQALGPDYDVEIVDIHHNHKKDAPSGTAIALEAAVRDHTFRANDVTIHGRTGHVGERPHNEIGIHALRAGDIVGDHTVYFCGPGERVEITHRAHSRDTFARGALRAAQFLLTRTAGLYTMRDVLGLQSAR
jgi:4-hydroxy-tetrahydrodipicolinate reductase